MVFLFLLILRAHARVLQEFVFFAVTSVTSGGGICVNIITTLERLLKNDSSVDRKRHVVLHKTTRCFTQNEPLFYIKRAVVLHKTTRRFFVKKGMEWLGSD